jgi:sulfate/thiosulfate transport system permease protein
LAVAVEKTIDLGERRDGPGVWASIGRTAARVSGPSLAVTYLSLLVLIPIAAVAAQAFDSGWGAFASAVTQPEAEAALELTLESALVVVAVNTIAGTAIAWVLTRDRFAGRRVLTAIVELPFALPTVVAGLTLLSVYGPDSPLHLDVAGTRLAVLVALAFVTLPFSVRSVQPVIEELDAEAEEAAASLGAGSFTVFRRVVLPSLAPSMLGGAALGFARALGEFGSLVFITGDRPFHTEVASVYIFGLFENDQRQAAAAVSVVLLVSSLVILLVAGAFRRRISRDAVST